MFFKFIQITILTVVYNSNTQFDTLDLKLLISEF